MLEKSRGLKVDTVAYDLEDSVTPSKKAEARHNLRELLARPKAEGIGEQAVRINSVDSGLALTDLTEVVSFLNFALYQCPFLNMAGPTGLLSTQDTH